MREPEPPPLVRRVSVRGDRWEDASDVIPAGESRSYVVSAFVPIRVDAVHIAGERPSSVPPHEEPPRLRLCELHLGGESMLALDRPGPRVDVAALGLRSVDIGETLRFVVENVTGKPVRCAPTCEAAHLLDGGVSTSPTLIGAEPRRLAELRAWHAVPARAGNSFQWRAPFAGRIQALEFAAVLSTLQGLTLKHLMVGREELVVTDAGIPLSALAAGALGAAVRFPHVFAGQVTHWGVTNSSDEEARVTLDLDFAIRVADYRPIDGRNRPAADRPRVVDRPAPFTSSFRGGDPPADPDLPPAFR